MEGTGTIEQREPSLADVARVSGYSTMTVSRALRGIGFVSDRARSDVIEAAQRVGYKAGCRQCGSGGTEFVVKESAKGTYKFCSRLCLVAFYSR